MEINIVANPTVRAVSDECVKQVASCVTQCDAYTWSALSWGLGIGFVMGAIGMIVGKRIGAWYRANKK